MLNSKINYWRTGLMGGLLITLVGTMAQTEDATKPVAPSKPVPGTTEATVEMGANADPLMQQYRSLPMRYGGGAGRTLGVSQTIKPDLVYFHANDKRALDNLSEDLSVMSFILDRTLQQNFGSAGPDYRMGIPLLVTGESTATPPLYLEGFGALFHLRVNFPLVEPEIKVGAPTPPTTTSDWDRARAEVLGANQTDTAGLVMVMESNAKVPYDGDRVAKLKEELLKALKNTANIRALRDGDFIGVMVQGTANNAGIPRAVERLATRYRGMSPEMLRRYGLTAPDMGTSETDGSVGGAGSGSMGGIAGGGGVGVVGEGLRESMLTIRVKKVDAVALAKGEISFDEFKSRATVTSNVCALPEAAKRFTFRTFGRAGVETAPAAK